MELYVDEVCSVFQNYSKNVAELLTMYKCQLCNCYTSSIDEFLRHFVHHVPNRIYFKDFTDSNNITDEEKFVCAICFNEFDTQCNVKEHMLKIHNMKNGNTTWINNNLDYTEFKINDLDCTQFPNLNDAKLGKEEDIKNSELLSDITGNIICLGPTSLSSLKSKLKKSFIHHCTHKGCLYKFETEVRRDLHIRCHINDNNGAVREFRCTECGIEHKKWRDCTKHMWKQHQIDIDLLKCPLCDYKSVIAVKIFHHLQIHGITKGYVCSFCDEKFQQLSQLRSHSIQHKHNSKTFKSRWYSQKNCEICHHTFANSKTLSKHIKTVHNKIKPFICNICGHKSARKNTWMIHMRQHNGAKPYSCKFCQFRSADPTVCRIHEKKHSQDKQYKCSLCSYASIQTISIKRHIKSNHKEEFMKIKCDYGNCKFTSINPEKLMYHKKNHQFGIIHLNDDSCENIELTEITIASGKSLLKQPDKIQSAGKQIPKEISSDCFLTIESADSINHDLPVFDAGGVTIPANSEDTQFSI